MSEIWRPVAGHEEYLEVSNLGRVRTVERIVPGVRRGDQKRKPILLAQRLAQTGYYRITSFIDGKRVGLYIHRLVAKAFVTGWFDGATVDHVDGNKLNNLPQNLEWVTHSENVRRMGDLRSANPRKGVPCFQMSHDEVRAIRSRVNAGESKASIAREFGRSQATVYRVLNGQCWSGVQ